MADSRDAYISISRSEPPRSGHHYETPLTQLREGGYSMSHEDGRNTSNVPTRLWSTDTSFYDVSGMSSVCTSESSTSSRSGYSTQQSSSSSGSVNITQQQTSSVYIHKAKHVHIASTTKCRHKKRLEQGTATRPGDGQQTGNSSIDTFGRARSLTVGNGEATDVQTDGDEPYATRGALMPALTNVGAGNILPNQGLTSGSGRTREASGSMVVKGTCCRRLKTTPVFVILIILIASVMGGVIGYIGWKKASEQETRYQSKGLVSVTVDDSFHPSMSDNSSAEFKAFDAKLCYSVRQKLSESALVKDCAVQNLSKGSIVARFSLDFLTTVNRSSEWLRSELLTSGNPDEDFTHWLSLRVRKSSLRAIILGSKLSDSSVKVEAAPTVDCTKSSFQPLPYTYPLYCGEFQVCTSTGIEYRKCPQGLEFSYVSEDNDVVCDMPSDSTYCGQKRRTNAATAAQTDSTTATSNTSTVPATKAESTTWVASKASIETTNERSSSTASTADATIPTYSPCPAFTVNAELYFDVFQCPTTGYVFIPRRDTFPDHCDGYVWCVEGKTYNDSVIKCGVGAHYTMKGDGPCYPAWHPDTFCQVMRRCQGYPT